MRSLGSRTSRRASPSTLKAKTAALMVRPGKMAIQGARSYVVDGVDLFPSRRRRKPYGREACSPALVFPSQVGVKYATHQWERGVRMKQVAAYPELDARLLEEIVMRDVVMRDVGSETTCNAGRWF